MARQEYELLTGQHSNSEKKRNLAGFWLLGLFNNFAYVIMLSAAHDLLREVDEEGHNENQTMTGDLNVLNIDNSSGRDCNPISTGAILLADILPAIAIKLLAPFIHLSVAIKVSAAAGLASGSFLLVSLARSRSLMFLGVICASLSSGLGEVTFLSYTHYFHPIVIAAWSSGTGGAGVLGSGTFAAFTGMGLTARGALLVMLIVPAGTLAAFACLLRPSRYQHPRRIPSSPAPVSTLLGAEVEEYEELQGLLAGRRLTCSEKLASIGGLLQYMLPLGLVYFFEYLINQGLFELIYFPQSSIGHSQQYRWYQICYQIGVLISRSSLHFIKIRSINSLALLQAINFVLLALQAVFWTVPIISIIFAVILWEGLLGGAAYVNTFYRISKEVEEDKREFSLGITSLADSSAIGLAGLVSLYLHTVICDLPIYTALN